MADVRNISVTAQGGDISGLISIAQGETVNLNWTCLDPATKLPLDLSASALICTVSCYSVAGLFKPISRQATLTSPSGGLGFTPLASGDTVPTLADPIQPGQYRLDLWAEDVPGNRVDLAYGSITVRRAERLPGAVVTPLPSQAPIAQGGLQLAPAVKTSAYTASFLDLVVADPTGGSFTVSLPSCASAVGSSNTIVIVNETDGANIVTVAPNGADTIRGLGLWILNAGESLRLTARTGRWVVW